MKKRNPIIVYLLNFLTFGLYNTYYLTTVVDGTNKEIGDKKGQVPVKLPALLIGIFILINFILLIVTSFNPEFLTDSNAFVILAYLSLEIAVPCLLVYSLWYIGKGINLKSNGEINSWRYFVIYAITQIIKIVVLIFSYYFMISVSLMDIMFGYDDTVTSLMYIINFISIGIENIVYYFIQKDINDYSDDDMIMENQEQPTVAPYMSDSFNAKNSNSLENPTSVVESQIPTSVDVNNNNNDNGTQNFGNL